MKGFTKFFSIMLVLALAASLRLPAEKQEAEKAAPAVREDP
jgi:hypothetical protein